MSGLVPRLETISHDLHEGSGVALIKGLAPERYTPWENVTMFAGITSYIGDARGVQDREGSMLS